MKTGILTTLLTSVLCLSLAAKDKAVVVKVTASTEADNYAAANVLDGNSQTMWHSLWTGKIKQHPHTLTFDLGKSYQITGFSALPRQDGCQNGMIADYEIYVSDKKGTSGVPVVKGSFDKSMKERAISLDQGPVNGRFVTLKVLSEVNGNKVYSSLAEFEIASPGVKFTAGQEANILSSNADVSEVEAQFNNLVYDLKRKNIFDDHAPETFNKESLILDSDRDPLDVILRRTEALIKDLLKLKGAPDFSGKKKTLVSLKKSADATACEDEDARYALFEKAHALRREIALSNPLLNFDQLLFIKRHRSTFNHMCDQYYGTFTLPGGGLYVLEKPFSDKPVCRDILADSVVESGRLKGMKLDKGGFLSPELSFDGRNIMFAYVECEGDKKHIDHLDHKNRGHWSRGRLFSSFQRECRWIRPSTADRWYLE